MKYCIDGITMSNIADAIRRKNPNYQTMLPATMVTAIDEIETGGGGGEGGEIPWSKIAAGLVPEDGAEVVIDFSGDEYEETFYQIKEMLFSNTKLRKLTGYLVKIVGEKACLGCFNLESVNLPDTTVLSIEAFANCNNLREVNIPNLESASDNAFLGVPFNGAVEFPKLQYRGYENIGAFEMPTGDEDGMTSFSAPLLPGLGQREFYGRARLQTVNLPEVKEIGCEAFAYCVNLQDFDFSKITYIDDQAFLYCTSLPAELHFPQLTHIGAEAFQDCGSLTKVYFCQRWDETPYMDPFENCENITDIYVPWSEGELEGAPWGAVNATIHYDTQYDDDGNVIG